MNDSKEQTDDAFCGLVLHGSEETFKQIKQFILSETDVSLVYQKKSPHDLTLDTCKPDDKTAP